MALELLHLDVWPCVLCVHRVRLVARDGRRAKYYPVS